MKRVPAGDDFGERTYGAVGGEVDETAVGGDEPAFVAVDRRDGADGCGDVVAATVDDLTGVVEPAAQHEPVDDVDRQELIATSVPTRALAENALFGGAGHGAPGTGRHRRAAASAACSRLCIIRRRKSLMSTPSVSFCPWAYRAYTPWRMQTTFQ